jgi:myo-inositol catabolism protein IolH
MTACVFAWEERAEDSSRFMLEEMTRRTRDWGDPAR